MTPKHVLICLLSHLIVLVGTAVQAQELPNLTTASGRRLTAAQTPAADRVVPSIASAAEADVPPTLPTLGPIKSREVKIEQVTERYPSGSAKTERHVIQDAAGNYVNHGAYKMYDPDGKVLRTGEFIEGRQHGAWKQTFAKDEGRLLLTGQEKEFAPPFVSEATFAEGKLHGTWNIQDNQGRKVLQWNFDHGVRSGKSLWWYASGKTWMEANYKQGVLDGEMREWDREGKVVSQATYLEGKCLVRAVGWYALGQKHFEGNYLRDVAAPEPSFDWWNSTAAPGAAKAPTKELRQGLWTSWYRNGNKKTEGQFDHDLSIGKFTWWYENGQKQAEGEFQAGQRSGVWTIWHLNGLKESEGRYENGSLVGPWMQWDSDGKVVNAQDRREGPGNSIGTPNGSIGRVSGTARR